ncbi:MAG: precorrin-8X methylmutase [Mogibacterium sp.]|nr:precorrin-8X methylmutase [Mogibacterium sp.]
MIEHVLPGDIEKRSFEIIAEELAAAGITLDPEKDPVIRRAIHTSADFDYARTLIFSSDAVRIARDLIQNGADIVTDTNMALTGINKKKIAAFGGSVRCYMADEDVAREARERGITRASVSMEHAARDISKSGRRTIFAIGNAPTALITLRNMHDEGIFTPDFIIGVPVGFVNVVEAKELIIETDIPHIVNRGRKGGSNVAAAIVNALIYSIQR